MKEASSTMRTRFAIWGTRTESLSAPEQPRHPVVECLGVEELYRQLAQVRYTP